MTFRIFSWFLPAIALVAAGSAFHATIAKAQDKPGYYTDPNTGIVYRQVTRTIERPVVETKIEKREQTVFRPETVTETKPESQTVYVPQTDHVWQPVLHGRWNPFRQPSVSYQHVPRTYWKPQEQVVTRTQSRTNWVAEKRTVDVPQKLVRMTREQKTDYEVVGRVAPPATRQPAAAPSNISEAVASRLRPLAANTAVQPMGQNTVGTAGRTFNVGGVNSYGVNTVPRVASTLGRMTSDPPRRGISQSGMRTTDLYPRNPTGYSQSLPPATTGGGIATLPGWSIFR